MEAAERESLFGGRKWGDEVVVVLKPVVLVPTPRQLADGVRVVDARDDQCPADLLRLRELAHEHGWTTRAAYSHALMPPGRGGEDWTDRYTVSLRLHRDGVRAWGAWGNGSWDGGQVADAGVIRRLGADAFRTVIDGIDRTPERGSCPFCRAEGLRITKAGKPYAHKFAGAPCPGML